VLAINDLKRTWYSQPTVLSQIREVFQRITERLKPGRVHGIGNSMGAYGAILFAAEMGMASSIAFSPQFSMRRTVVPEPRWENFRPNFGNALAESLGPALAAAPGDTWILHGALGLDIRHYTKFPIHPRVHHAILQGGKHALAAKIKQSGLLASFVGAAFAGEADRAESVLAPFHPMWRRTGSREETAEIRAARNRHLAAKTTRRAIRQGRKNRA
jgi:hypothetical protein